MIFAGDARVCVATAAAYQAVHHVAQLWWGVMRGVGRLNAAVGIGAVRLHTAVVVRHRRERRGLGPAIAMKSCCSAAGGRLRTVKSGLLSGSGMCGQVWRTASRAHAEQLLLDVFCCCDATDRQLL